MRRPGPRSERGAALLLALGLTLFISVIVPPLLVRTSVGSRTSSTVIAERRALYAAASAADAAVQNGRVARWVGRYGLVCPTLTMTTDAVTATVTCSSSTRAGDIDRTLTYASAVNGRTQVRVTVIFRDSTAGSGLPATDLVSWSSVAG